MEKQILRIAVVAVFLVAAGCGSDSKLALGQQCTQDGQCATGICVFIDSQRICTELCTAGTTCDSVDAPVCRESGHCGPPCSFTGASDGYLCNLGTGMVFPCGEGDPASHCTACGCDAFGGGVCVPGTGCIDPLPDDSPCTIHEMCQSGLCDPVSETCRPEVLQGEPCRYDIQCVTRNCNNDGDVSSEGVCAQQLGTTCTNGDDCTRCIDTFLSGFCSRSNCDLNTAPNCPPEWECLLSVEGDYHCYESCDPDNYDLCTDAFASCRPSGYCS